MCTRANLCGVCAHEYRCSWSQRRALDALELGYRWLCNLQMWVLGNKLGSSGTLCALNHWSHLSNPRKVFQILCYLKNVLASLGICLSFTYIGNKKFQCIFPNKNKLGVFIHLQMKRKERKFWHLIEYIMDISWTNPCLQGEFPCF